MEYVGTRCAIDAGMNENDYEIEDREAFYSYAEQENNDRLDYASYVRESNDWRDAGEIRMGA